MNRLRFFRKRSLPLPLHKDQAGSNSTLNDMPSDQSPSRPAAGQTERSLSEKEPEIDPNLVSTDLVCTLNHRLTCPRLPGTQMMMLETP